MEKHLINKLQSCACLSIGANSNSGYLHVLRGYIIAVEMYTLSFSTFRCFVYTFINVHVIIPKE